MARQSAVIKASTSTAAPAVGLGLRTFQLNDVMKEAAAQLESTRNEAARILQDAKDQAAVIERRAHEAGHKEGFEKGVVEGREAGRVEAFESARQEFAQKQQSLIQACTQLMAGIEADRVAWCAAARHDLIDLALVIARRVVHHVGEHHREVVLANLEEAVRIVGARSDVFIAVHPDDAEAARSFAESLVDLQEHWEHVRVVAEPEVSPGGCRIHWGTGAIDATLETQLDRISAELRGDSAPSVNEASTQRVEDK